MAATHPHGPDFISEEKIAESDNMKGQPLPVKNEGAIPPNASCDAATIGHPRNSAGHSGNFGLGGDHTLYSPNIYAPQANTIFYRGYDNGVSDWEEYPTYLNADGMEIRSPGVYNENPSLVFHSGYGYNPQMPYGPYSPVTTPLPSVGGDGQLYSPQQFPYSGTPYYQQLGPSSTPFIPSQTPVSQPELATVLSVDRQGDNMFGGARPGYPPVGSFGRGNFPDNSSTIGFHDVQHEFDELRSGGLWSDWSKPSDRQRPLSHLSPAASPQPTHPIGSFGQNVGISSQQQRSPYGFGGGSNYYNRDYLPSGLSQGNSPGNVSFSSLGANSQGWLSLENSRRRPRGGGSLCSCNNSPLDILNEQNRGPRALKPKIQITDDGSSMEKSKHNMSTALVQNESYNRSDFLTEYKDAKFFIIKSYSEDNVHKSIKYGVWASTPNGNKKLDAAYHEATEKQDTCPVFLLFSVNASAQFCGVAEMIGPVDFDKSVDYWQQDKWCGQFPVKWHIIKDVPNSQFRHIILASNDNKPVTNSRDTQEVKWEHGIEMLKIFNNYEYDMSILDDFDFYEDRQKAMQERKARQQQQASLVAVGAASEDENRSPVTLPTDFIKQMSKSFAQVVCVDEGSKEAVTVNASSVDDVSMGSRLKLEDAITGAVPSGQTN